MAPKSVLIVEDESIVALELKGTLSELGYDVNGIADNGMKAIQLAEELSPDIILMDITIKGDIDGIETAEHIQKKQRSTIIFTTARSDDENLARVKTILPYGYLIKPVTERELKATLEVAVYLSTVEKEREATLTSLERSERRFKRLFNGLDSGVYILEAIENGRDFKFIDLNQSVETIEQISREELVDASLTDKFPGVLEVGLLAVLQRVWRTGEAESLLPFFYEDERVSGWKKYHVYKLFTGELVAIYDDITEKYEAKRALSETEELFRKTLEALNDGVVVYNDTFNIVFSNQKLEAILAPNQASHLFSLNNHLSPGSLEKLQTSFQTSLSQKSPVTIELKASRADGEAVYLRVSSNVILKNGSIDKVIASFSDFTPLKESEKELRESEDKYRRLTENAKDAIYRMAIPSGDLEYISPAIIQISGYTPDELYADRLLIRNLVHPDWQMYIRKQWDLLLVGKSPPEYEYQIISKKDKIKWISQRSNLVFDGLDKPVAIEAIMTDITQRKSIENEFFESHSKLENEVEIRTADYKKAKEDAERANSLKTEFLANISHELRTPMHAILNYSKYGSDKFFTNAPDKNIHYFKQIRTAGERLINLLNNLLDLSRMESGKEVYKQEPLNVWQIASEAITEFETVLKEKSIAVNISDPGIKTKIIGDEYKIGQVMRNLISNAIKFSKRNRTVEIKFEKSFLNGPFRDSHALKTIIIDQGCGIPPGELNLIFEKFNQSSKTKTGAGGTGLGLSICKNIIEAHNGKIWANNNQMGGATFTFLLPYR